MICKTRKLSLAQQGMRNGFMNFGLVFETVLGMVLCYTPFIQLPLGMRPLQFRHFGVPALPFFTVIMIYDEVRKLLLRVMIPKKEGWADEHRPGYGWFYRNT